MSKNRSYKARIEAAKQRLREELQKANAATARAAAEADRELQSFNEAKASAFARAMDIISEEEARGTRASRNS